MKWPRCLGHEKRRRPRVERGFSLVEVMGATVIVTVGLLATLALMLTGTTVNADAKRMAQAYQAAQQEIELLRNMPYRSTGAFAGLASVQKPASTNNTVEARFLKPDGADDASRPGDTGYPGLVPALAQLPSGAGGLIITDDPMAGNQCKRVTVIVRWKDPGNVDRSVAVGTMIAEGGIDPR